jgi:hypothetical protein
MSEYIRATRACGLDGLEPQMAAAIRAHIQKHELGGIPDATLMCIETTATRQKKGLLRRKTEVILAGVLLTPQWLIWAVGEAGDVPAVLSARLRDIRVQDYERSEMYTLVQDSGLNILGLRTDTAAGTAFIGLGPEPAAQRFRTALKEAIEKA